MPGENEGVDYSSRLLDICSRCSNELLRKARAAGGIENGPGAPGTISAGQIAYLLSEYPEFSPR